MAALAPLYARSERFSFVPMDDDLVMMDIEHGKYLGLNAVAADIWRLLEQPKSASQLLSLLLERYEVSAAQCDADLQRFLVQMLSQGMLVQIDAD
jgi:hypothetical protein